MVSVTCDFLLHLCKICINIIWKIFLMCHQFSLQRLYSQIFSFQCTYPCTDFHWIGQLGRFSHRVTMSVGTYVCLSVCPLWRRPLLPLERSSSHSPKYGDGVCVCVGVWGLGGCHVSCVMCHMSHVTCHMSHVTCHMSHVTCHVSDF